MTPGFVPDSVKRVISSRQVRKVAVYEALMDRLCSREGRNPRMYVSFEEEKRREGTCAGGENIEG